MKKTLYALAFLGAALLGASQVTAEYRIPDFTLVPDSVCTGGTLLREYTSVYDAPSTFDAEGTAARECQTLMSGQNQCCSVSYRGIAPANSTMGGSALGTHSFTYQIYKGGTIGAAPAGDGTLVGARTYWAGTSGTAAAQPTAGITANPTAITEGESSLITWASTGADRCTSAQFDTQNRTTGSVLVSPLETTVYAVTCNALSGSATAQVRVIVSPRVVTSGSFDASCRAHPSRAGVGEDVLWSSTVSGPPGLYYYSWSGTEGLAGTASQIFKQYATEGFKSAQLTVTFKPQPTSQANSIFAIPEAHAACIPVTNQGKWYSGASVVTANEGLNSAYDCAQAALNAGYSYWNRSVRTTTCTSGSCVVDPVFTVCYGLNTPGSLVSKGATSEGSGTNSDPRVETVFDSGNVCGGGSCQNPTPTFNVIGSSCTGGTVIGREKEMLDAVMIGMWPEGGIAQKCADLGAEPGDCCEYAQKSSTSYGGGFPANSYYSFRVVRGGTASSEEINLGCNLKNSLEYQCSSVAGSIGTTCGTGEDDGTKSITVDCDNGVQVGTGGGGGECSDGIDNDGDGDIDARDRGCTTGGTYNPEDPTEGSTGNTTPQCADGRDNNGDGLADYPDDPGCSSQYDNLELVEPPDLSFTVNPPLIKKNQQCTLSLSARSISTCTLTGPGVARSFSGVNGFLSLKEVITPGLSQTSTYTLSCTGLNGKKASKSVDCKIAPTFEEI